MNLALAAAVALWLLATSCGPPRVLDDESPMGKDDGIEMVCVLNAPTFWPREPVLPECPERARSTPRYEGRPCGGHVAVPAQRRGWEVPVDVEPLLR